MSAFYIETGSAPAHAWLCSPLALKMFLIYEMGLQHLRLPLGQREYRERKKVDSELRADHGAPGSSSQSPKATVTHLS